MVLVKCKCGCFYTLNQVGLRANVDLDRRCPNCRAEHKLSNYQSIWSVDNILETDIIEIQRIPDNASVEVSYRLC